MNFKSLFDLNHTICKNLFEQTENPWEILPIIKKEIISIGKSLNDDYEEVDENIWIHKSVIIYDTATIIGPCIIGENTEIRPGAFIRENVIIGDNCVIGNSSEIKNSIIFDNAQIPHFNYVGDSILGYKAHMGAGAITSNLKSDKTNIVIKGKENIETNLRKLGALLGDNSEIGCNAVLCPGTIIFPNSNVYPLTMVRGVIEENSIVKSMDNIVTKKEIGN